MDFDDKAFEEEVRKQMQQALGGGKSVKSTTKEEPQVRV